MKLKEKTVKVIPMMLQLPKETENKLKKLCFFLLKQLSNESCATATDVSGCCAVCPKRSHCKFVHFLTE